MTHRSARMMVVGLVLGLSALGITKSALVGTDQRALAEGATANKSSHELVKQQIELAKAAMQELFPLQRQGQISADVARITVWSHRLINGLRKRGGDKGDLATALSQHASQMEANVGRVKQLYDANVATHQAVLDAQYGLLEAELSLAELRGDLR